jgi:hypothetical protein
MLHTIQDALGFFGVAATGVAIILLVRAGRRSYGAANSNLDLPRCAKCRYGLVSMPSSICPECGTDVTQTGVHPPGKRGLPGAAVLIVWTLLCAVPLFFADALIPIRLIEATHQREIRLVSTNSNISKFDKVVFFAEGAFLGFAKSDFTLAPPPIPVESARLIAHVAGKGEIQIEATKKNFRVAGDPQLYPYDESAIRARLGAPDGGSGDLYAEVEVRELAAMLSEVLAYTATGNLDFLNSTSSAPHWMATGTSGGSSSYVIMSSIFLLYPVVLILWTIGVLKILPCKRDIIRGQQAVQLVTIRN